MGILQSVSYAGSGLGYTQTFGYDELNRLTTSQEGSSWSQTNSYDRYGNRSVSGGLSFSVSPNKGCGSDAIQCFVWCSRGNRSLSTRDPSKECVSSMRNCYRFKRIDTSLEPSAEDASEVVLASRPRLITRYCSNRTSTC